jgi:hypothetical protein
MLIMAIDIADRRELLWDHYLIDESLTTAHDVMHHPVRRELIMTNNAPWEADGWTYYTILLDNGLYRMYYLCMPMYNREHTKHDPPFHHICYSESKDGIHWDKPRLNICEYNGSAENNIVVITDTMDAFHVFVDKNPLCPPNEIYKAVYTKPGNRLWCMTSADGIHFSEGWEITDKGKFDSHNTAFWDPEKQKYICHFRDFHDRNNTRIRDIRRIESLDFKTWSKQEAIAYTDNRYDYHMYTNGIQPYYRAPHLYIGLPARYTERIEWTSAYDRLCGAQQRKRRMQYHPRYGLALTDGLLMTSRDLETWVRHNEAFIRPGPESRLRWVYGDGYAGHGLVPTQAENKGEDDEISLYVSGNHWSDEPVQVWRHTIRADGFISLNAGYEPLEIVTKPIRFKGDKLEINFATSAAGESVVQLCDELGNILPGYASAPQFGDSIDRQIDFPKPVKTLEGTPVRLRFILRDADLFSFKFSDDGSQKTRK